MPGHRKPEQLSTSVTHHDKRKRRSNVTVGTTQRSIAAIASAWLRRNVRQFCDGGPRCRIMYLETVDSAISNPSFSSSLWMRGAVDGVHLEQPLILLYKRVLRLREDALKRWLVKVLKGGHHR